MCARHVDVRVPPGKLRLCPARMTTTDFGGKFGISCPRSQPINFSEFISPW